MLLFGLSAQRRPYNPTVRGDGGLVPELGPAAHHQLLGGPVSRQALPRAGRSVAARLYVWPDGASAGGVLAPRSPATGRRRRATASTAYNRLEKTLEYRPREGAKSAGDGDLEENRQPYKRFLLEGVQNVNKTFRLRNEILPLTAVL